MISDWQHFLEQNGAIIEAGQVTHFGKPEAELEAVQGEDIIADLSHLGLIRASGEECRDFLQGQFSNDVRNVDENNCQLNSYNSPKGRIIAAFRLLQRDSDFYLQLPRERLEPTLKRLRMFVLMSKVVLEDASDSLVCLGIAGPNAEKIVADATGIDAPAQVDGVTHDGSVTVLRLAGTVPRFEIIAPQQDARDIWNKAAAEGQPAGVGVWELLEIRAGLPSIYTDTAESFVPQMVNLHLINGVNFKKGCYPGQEIVARMQYLGKLKRRMYLASVDVETPPQPGDKVFAANTESGQGAGNVVKAARSPAGGFELLVVADTATLEQQALHLESETGPELRFAELPYRFEDAQTA